MMVNSWRRDRETRLQTLGRLSLILAFVSAASAITNLTLYFDQPAWQLLAISGITGLGAGLFATVRGMSARGDDSQATYLLVSTLMAMVPLTKLFWTGGAIYGALAGVGVSGLVILLIVPPDQRLVLWVINLLVGGVTLATERISLPWPQLNAGGTLWRTALLRMVIVGAAGLVLWLALRAYRRIVSIQRRLTVAIIGLVFVAAALVSATSIVVGIRNARERTYRQLESTVVLKKQSLNTWVEQLQFSLDSLIVEDYELERALSLLMGSLSDEYRVLAQQELSRRFNVVMERTQWYEEIFMVNPEGEVVFSTDRDQIGTLVASETYFTKGMEGSYVQAPRYDPIIEDTSVIFSRPVLGPLEKSYGVLAARSSASLLDPVMESGPLGDVGETYLVGPDFVMVTETREDTGLSPTHSPGIDHVITGRPDMGRDTYEDYRGVPVLGVYTWVPSLNAGLIGEIDASEVVRGARTTLFVNAGVAALIIGGAALASVVISRQITAPLLNLSQTAAEISEGNLDLTAPVEREDEIGTLAHAFNQMTGQLRDLINSLESRVRDRTAGLQAVNDVSRATTSVLDPNELLPQVVDLVQTRFDLYYVGLFLLNEEGTQAVLQAGSGEAGRAMLDAGWQLAANRESMIGECVSTGRPVVKQQAGDDVVQFENPYLPETRSELALPLRYGERIIGAMTVQSIHERAFDDTDIGILQNMADQVAVAVENARLFAETQSALDRAHRVQQRYREMAWSEYLGTRTVTGYEQRGMQVAPLEGGLIPEAERAIHTGETHLEDGRLTVPIVQGDQVLGVLGVERDTPWAREDVALVESLADQLALAADNQRLLDDISRSAAMEQTIGEITSNIRAEVEIESVVERALSELAGALDAERGAIRLSFDQQEERA